MEVSTTGSLPLRDPETWRAATQLQKALFTELFRSAGFAEAFSTGSNALDALSSQVIESIAEQVASSDESMAEAFYQQLARLRD